MDYVLLYRVTTHDIYNIKAKQVVYTGWHDEESKMIDDGIISRLEEQTFRLTAAIEFEQVKSMETRPCSFRGTASKMS